MENLVIMKNQQAVTTSLQVAENFNKRHSDVLESIKNLVTENSVAKYFFEGTYENRGKNYPLYFMNRDGFTLLAMSFTGKQALQFKLKYIDAFNRMENHIKQELDTSNLSPELQMFNGLFQALANQELETKRVESKVDNIANLVQIDSRDWRKDAVKVLRTIAIKRGGLDQFKETANESYLLLENRAKCDLDIRLTNRQRNMIAQGVGRSRVKKFNKLDVIAEDARLIEIYVSVIKDMAIRNNIDFARSDN